MDFFPLWNVVWLNQSSIQSIEYLYLFRFHHCCEVSVEQLQDSFGWDKDQGLSCHSTDLHFYEMKRQ